MRYLSWNCRCLWVGAFLILAAMRAFAYPPDYGPFEVGSAPKKSCVKPWMLVRDEPSRWLFSSGSNSTAHVFGIEKIDLGEGFRYVFTITNGGNQIFRYATEDAGPSGWDLKVYSGLINNDGVSDYVVVSGGTGNGILGWHQIVVFILSTKGSYHAVPIESWGANPLTDLVDVDGDGQCEFIQTTYISGEKGKDGRYHNYWAHNLLRFEGTRCVSANKSDSRFPRWVWFTFKPNHSETDQITQKQRVAIWSKQRWEECNYPNFPHQGLAVDLKK